MQHKTMRPWRHAASKYKGVVRSHDGVRWDAIFHVPGSRGVKLGTFLTEAEAAEAYDEVAKAFHGDDAFLNSRDFDRQIKPVVEGPIAKIPCAPDYWFQIDAADLPVISQQYWRWSPKSGVKGVRGIALHTVLLGSLPPSHVVAHINGDKFDFRRQNLAIVHVSVLAGRNRKRSAPSSSIYKGVRRSRWGWDAKLAGAHIGSFTLQEEAAKAYDAAARRKWGIFAAVNFPRPGEISCLGEAPRPMQLAA